MPKRNSLKKNTNIQLEETSSGSKKAKASSASKKPSNEIDTIFSGKKRKNPDQLPNKSVAENPKSLEKKQKKKSREEKEGNFADPSAKSRRKTEDGFTIYTEGELGINNGNAGGTPLCPFDCDCCF